MLTRKYGTSCTKHTALSCPRKCWVPNRTVLSWFDDKFTWARTYDTSEAAQAIVEFEAEQIEQRINDYLAKNLPVPEQHYKWVHKVWDGANDANAHTPK